MSRDTVQPPVPGSISRTDVRDPASSKERQEETIVGARRRCFKAISVVTAVLLSLALAEVVLRIVGVPPPVISGWKATTPPFLGRNELGYRGQSIAYESNDKVVVLLGDSQVEAQACAFPQLPEQRLEHYLRAVGVPAKVFGVGAAGYGQAQELLALEEFLARYRADLVLVLLTPMNDVFNNVFPTNWPTDGVPKPTFWLEGGELRGPTSRILETISPSCKVEQLVWQVTLAPSDAAWEERLPAPYEGPRAPDTFSTEWQRWWDTGHHAINDENLLNEKSHLTMLLAPRSPRTQYGIRLTQALLSRMERMAAAAGARFGAILLDGVYIPETVEMVYSLNGRYYTCSGKQLEANLRDLIATVPAFRVEVTTRPWKVGGGDNHLNPTAVDQVMRDLAPRLVPRLSD